MRSGLTWHLPQLGQPDRAIELTEKALKLNPNYPYWYNQAIRYAYFFGRQFDKSVKYSKLITEPFATDYAYLAAASAMMRVTPAIAQRGSQISAASATIEAPITNMTPAPSR